MRPINKTNSSPQNPAIPASTAIRKPRRRSKKSKLRRRKKNREKRTAQKQALAADLAAQQERIIARAIERRESLERAKKPASLKRPSPRVEGPHLNPIRRQPGVNPSAFA